MGWDRDGDGESVGHEMGRHIVELRGTRTADLGEEDVRRMRKVVGHVHRHLAQGGPKEDVEHARWRSSLVDWGHDPLEDWPRPRSAIAVSARSSSAVHSQRIRSRSSSRTHHCTATYALSGTQSR